MRKLKSSDLLEYFVFLQERNQLIDKQYNTDREKLQKIRLLMVTASYNKHDKKLLQRSVWTVL